MQRKLGWMAALAVAVGCGSPQETRTDASPSPAAPATPGGGFYASPSPGAPDSPVSGEFAAEVVAVDATGRTVTLREFAVGGTAAEIAAARAGTITVSVEGAAGDGLRDFKAGDRVVVSCRLKAPIVVTGTASPAPANLLSSCSAVTAIRKAG